MAVINPSESYLDEKDEISDKKKRTIEKDLERDLVALFAVIANEWAILYSATGTSVDINQYLEELESILRKSYRRTTNWFQNDFLRDLEHEQGLSDDDEYYAWLIGIRNSISPALILFIQDYLKKHPKKQSKLILETTQKVINKNIINSVVTLNESDELITNALIAETARKSILKENRNRVETIADNEVNQPMQDVRFQEVNLFSAELTRQTVLTGEALYIEKKWRKRDWDRTRPLHKVANGQRKQINQPFIVGGELLNYPKDTSLGASLWNIMNCHCTSVYV